MGKLKDVYKFVDPQGQKAGINGRELERLVETELGKYGVGSTLYSKYRGGKEKGMKGVLLKNVPYTNIYGTESRGEFVLCVRGHKNVRIECRSQTSAGSVDEKFPYLLGSCKAFKEDNVIVVLEGEGYRKGAKEWFIDNARAVKFKNIKVMSFREFKIWAEKGMLFDKEEICYEIRER